MNNWQWKSHVNTLLLCLVFSGCAALPFVVLPPLIEFAGGMIKTAINNYNKPYNNDLQDLMLSLRQQQANPFPQLNNSDADQGFPQNPYDDYPNPDEQNVSEQNAQEQYYPEEVNDQYPDQQYEESSLQSGQDKFKSETYEQSTEQPSPISLDVLLVRKTIRNGAVTLLPINDGDVMRDGRGIPQAGDKFRVMFRANINCHVYVISIDGSAWAQGVFPPPGNPFANPVVAGKQYVIPEDDNWFSLDQFQGIETIFFVASHQKRDDIETIMTRIAGHERNPSDTPDQVTEAPIIPEGFAGARRSPSPFAIQTGFHQGQQLLPTTFFAKTAGEALRVTRWFRHE